ncbi:MAG: response regulator transcription factor [Opitutaceae bacterium]
MTAAAHRIRILIVDDSELVRMGLRTLLSGYAEIEVVAEADCAAAALREFRARRPDLVLLDLRLPDGNGCDICRQILREQRDCRILVLSSLLDARSVSEAITAGAHGYLIKDINGPGLVQGIMDVAAGRTVLAPAITSQVMTMMRTNQHQELLRKRFDSLSAQEQRVLAHVARGLTNKEVALELGLSEKTVKNYLSNLFEKLQVSRRSQAVAFYAEVKT